MAPTDAGEGDENEIPTLRDGEGGASVSTLGVAEWAEVPIDSQQSLVAGRMDIDDVGEGVSQQRKQAIEYCTGKLTEAETFSAPVGWQTEIVPGLTVEELIGGFLTAADTSHLTDDDRTR